MFWSKNKKKVYPCKPQIFYIKLGCKGVLITRTCFHDALVLMSVSVLPSPSVRLDDMSLVVRKRVFGVSDQVPHKPGCTATEDGQRLEISDLGSRWIVLSV